MFHTGRNESQDPISGYHNKYEQHAMINAQLSCKCKNLLTTAFCAWQRKRDDINAKYMLLVTPRWRISSRYSMSPSQT